MNSDSDLFDALLDRQVEEFNQRMEASGNFHKYVLQMVCSERMRQDFETIHNPSSISGVGRMGKSLLRRVSRITGLGRTQQRPPTKKSETPETQPDIIEGEFRVLSDPSDN